MMLKLLTTIALIATCGFALPAKASEPQATDSLQPLSTQVPPQAQPTARDVLDACVQNRAETLPNPFVDVPANHWAFKAVLTMHYCGAFRQATPPSLIEKLLNQQTPAPQS